MYAFSSRQLSSSTSDRSSVFAILKFFSITRALPVFAVYTMKIVVSVVSFLKVSMHLEKRLRFQNASLKNVTRFRRCRVNKRRIRKEMFAFLRVFS